MEKWFEKFGIGENLRKNIVAILLIAAGGTIIYGLPYFRYDYYDAYLETYNLTNTQMGTFGSIFGVFGMISYLFGGYVVDKFSTKIVLTVSLILTGLGGIIHLFPVSYGVLLALYAMWGFTSLFAFWPACVKGVRMLSDEDAQGKGFGIFEGARGVVSAIMTPLAVFAFSRGVKSLDEARGMTYIIIFYSVLTILSGILIYFKMDDEGTASTDKVEFKDLGTVLKMPAVWIIGIVTFCTYTFTMSVYYFVPYATSILGATVIFGATLSAISKYLAPVSNVGGGFLSDRLGTSNLLLISFGIMAIGIAAILLLPLNSSMIIIFSILFLVIYFFYQVNYALVWAMMEEGKVPMRVSGTAAGVISTIGYLPEIFISLLAGSLLDNYPGVMGYRYLFGFLIFMMLVGIVSVLVWKKHLKDNKDIIV